MLSRNTDARFNPHSLTQQPNNGSHLYSFRPRSENGEDFQGVILNLRFMDTQANYCETGFLPFFRVPGIRGVDGDTGLCF